MKVKIINKSKHPLPSYETLYSAGMDIRADIDNTVRILPGERVLIGTSLYIELPKGCEAQIRPRSGMAYKYGLTVLNAPGTIDADYRGEIKVLLINHSDEAFDVEDGMRIAQMIVAKHERIDWEPSDHLNDTERGAGGYGHTGEN